MDEVMEFKSRIFANSQGQTIDAVGNGRYLVCHQTRCAMVKGWRQAQIAFKREESPMTHAHGETPDV